MGSWSTPLNPIGIIGDTIINSKNYISIGQSQDSTFDDINNTTFFCGVREINQQYIFVQANDTVEYKLYDFGVNAGDTVTINNPFTVGITNFKVVSVDSVLILGQYRKRVNVDELTMGGWPEAWIKGIGSTVGLPFTGFHVFDAGYELICFHENDTTVYNVSPTGDCYYQTVSIEELTMSSRELIKTIDLMGRETEDQPNTPLIYIYSDGTTEKVFRME